MDGRATLHICVVLAIVSGTGAQTVTVSISAGITEAGTDVSLTCTVNGGKVYGNNIQWLENTGNDAVTIFNGMIPFSASQKYNNFNVTSLSGTESEMTIHNAEVQDDGNYRCNIPTDENTSPVNLEVEVPGTVMLSLTSVVINNDDVYEATCNVVGSKPQVTIMWTIDGVIQTDGKGNTIVETNPQEPDNTPSSNTRSVFTFPVTQENHRKTLVCKTSGHQITGLNRQGSVDLNIHNSPLAAGTTVTADYLIHRSGIRVTCAAINEPEPVMRNYYIFSNGTLIHKSVESVSEITVLDPEVGTEYTCMAGNYLGNTSLGTPVTYPTKPDSDLCFRNGQTCYCASCPPDLPKRPKFCVMDVPTTQVPITVGGLTTAGVTEQVTTGVPNTTDVTDMDVRTTQPSVATRKPTTTEVTVMDILTTQASVKTDKPSTRKVTDMDVLTTQPSVATREPTTTTVTVMDVLTTQASVTTEGPTTRKVTAPITTGKSTTRKVADDKTPSCKYYDYSSYYFYCCNYNLHYRYYIKCYRYSTPYYRYDIYCNCYYIDHYRYYTKCYRYYVPYNPYNSYYNRHYIPNYRAKVRYYRK